MARRKGNPEFYSIPYPCECGCGGFVMNPDDHGRYRKFLPDHYDNKGEKHPRFGVKEDLNHLASRVDAIKKVIKANPPTGIERDLYRFLDKAGVFYIKQVRLGVTIVDAYLPDYKLCVFADGAYWHEKPNMAEADERHNKILEENGYKVIRLKSINYGKNLNFKPLIEYFKAIN